jgi:O-antigen/teichoic acid export membrane protein
VALLMLFVGMAGLLLFAAAGKGLFAVVFDPGFRMEFWPYGFYAVLTGFFNAYFRAATVALIYYKKPYVFLAVNAANAIVTVAVSIIGLQMYPDTIIGPVYGRLISGVLIFLFALLIFSGNGTLVFERSFLGELAAFCIPYVFYVLSMWVLSQIDRYILQSHVTKAELNSYDLLLKCFFGIEFIQNSLSAVIFPKVYAIWNAQGSLRTSVESNRYFNVFTAINIIQLIVFCIVLPLVYRLLIHNDIFFQAEAYIGIVAAGFGLRSATNFYLAGILFSKRTPMLLRIFGICAIFQIALTVILIRAFGLYGAIYAGLATRLLQIPLCSVFMKGVFEFEFNFVKIIGFPLLYLLINAIQFMLGGYSLAFYLAELALFVILFYWIYRNEIAIVARQFFTPTPQGRG